MEQKYNIGDLVEFTTPALFESAMNQYSNPGIVLDINARAEVNNVPATYTYTVRWNDGRITKEWWSYLKRLN